VTARSKTKIFIGREPCRDAPSQDVLKRRCNDCHTGAFGTQLAFKLTRPEKLLILLAPLAPSARGHGMPKMAETGDKEVVDRVAVLKHTRNPDYQALLASIRRTKEQLDRVKRFDMPQFRPNEHYVREMKFYGVLPKDFAEDAPIDVYQADQAYWRSLW
jgi:hypothetical protein